MPRDHGTSSLNTQITSAVDVAITRFQAAEAQNISAAVANLASTSYINNAISQALQAYVTITSLASTLGLYVSTAALNTILNSYVTLTALSNALMPYAQTSTVNSSISAAVAPLNSNITGLQGGLNSAVSNIGSNTSGIRDLQTGLNTANTNISALQSSTSAFTTSTTNALNTLNASTGTNTSNISTLQGSVSSLQSGLATANSNIGNNTAQITALQSTTSTNSSNITALQSGLSVANGQISTNSSTISALQSGLNTAKDNISSNSTSITQIQGALPGLATIVSVNSAVTTLSTAVTNWLTGYLQLSGGTLTGLLTGTAASFTSFIAGASSFVYASSLGAVSAVMGATVLTKGLVFQNLSGASSSYVTLKAPTPSGNSFSITLPDTGGSDASLQYAGAAVNAGNNPISGGAGTFTGLLTASNGVSANAFSLNGSDLGSSLSTINNNISNNTAAINVLNGNPLSTGSVGYTVGAALQSYLKLSGGTLTGLLKGTTAQFTSFIAGAANFVTNSSASAISAVMGYTFFTQGIAFQNTSGSSTSYVSLNAAAPGGPSFSVTLPDTGGTNATLQYQNTTVNATSVSSSGAISASTATTSNAPPAFWFKNAAASSYNPSTTSGMYLDSNFAVAINSSGGANQPAGGGVYTMNNGTKSVVLDNGSGGSTLNAVSVTSLSSSGPITGNKLMISQPAANTPLTVLGDLCTEIQGGVGQSQFNVGVSNSGNNPSTSGIYLRGGFQQGVGEILSLGSLAVGDLLTYIQNQVPTFQKGLSVIKNLTITDSNASRLTVTPNGASGAPSAVGSVLLSTYGTPGIPQVPLVYQSGSNASNGAYQSNFIITPNPSATYPFTAASNPGNISPAPMGPALSFYNDGNTGFNGTTYYGNGQSSSTGVPVFQTLTPNATGSALAFSGGLSTKNVTVDDTYGNMRVAGGLNINGTAYKLSTSGFTASVSGNSSDSTIANLIDGNGTTAWQPSSNSYSSTQNLANIAFPQQLSVSSVTVYFQGATSNTPNAIVATSYTNALTVYGTVGISSNAGQTGLQSASVTFAKPLLLTGISFLVTGSSSTPAYLSEVSFNGSLPMLCNVPALFNASLGTVNNYVDDGNGNSLTSGNSTVQGGFTLGGLANLTNGASITGNVIVKGNTITGSNGVQYSLPTGASGPLALTSQLPLTGLFNLTGTSPIAANIVTQSGGAGFSVTGGNISIPSALAGKYFTITVCYTGSVPAGTGYAIVCSASNSALIGGSLTGSGYNNALSAQPYTVHNTYYITVPSQGSSITSSITGYTTNTGATLTIRGAV